MAARWRAWPCPTTALSAHGTVPRRSTPIASSRNRNRPSSATSTGSLSAASQTRNRRQTACTSRRISATRSAAGTWWPCCATALWTRSASASCPSRTRPTNRASPTAGACAFWRCPWCRGPPTRPRRSPRSAPPTEPTEKCPKPETRKEPAWTMTKSPRS